jgi:hypothetical protein
MPRPGWGGLSSLRTCFSRVQPTYEVGRRTKFARELMRASERTHYDVFVAIGPQCQD